MNDLKRVLIRLVLFNIVGAIIGGAVAVLIVVLTGASTPAAVLIVFAGGSIGVLVGYIVALWSDLL